MPRERLWPVLAEHPKNVYLPEAAVIDPINGYISHVFSPAQREATVRAMLGVAGEVDAGSGRVADVRRRATQAETRLRRLQQAIEAGASPAALVEPINRAQQERDVAEDELARLPVGVRVGRAEMEAMVDSLSCWDGRSTTRAQCGSRSCTGRSGWRWSITQKSGWSM